MKEKSNYFPYVSQWASGKYNSAIMQGMDPCCDPNWSIISGFVDEKVYRFWSWKMCGIAAFRFYLLCLDKKCLSSFQLLQMAIERRCLRKKRK
ncbi:hypothetical protein LLS47_22580 [Rouxiella badensis]|uniref:Uncharacterized protein n=1 Tax=Rahnella perminowiae TaxID=2816244 RepID=A0ABS6KWW6_9GAMM|nr:MULTISPECIES: hypothetical protein [Yersiniaceae]MBU9808260.1 hypothetical protein [Rahnella perminowiae]MBU9833535.1 hypothetical protein [Rahnella perminowiae]MBU9848828.1 hypothetical protein [Rahnella aceris]MBU9860213.1 hypothetical protein [Rahnella aceris]MBU9864149.1 hypothetical protein [Rahnella aceris]